MIYQVRTFFPLCSSKRYCKDPQSLHRWIDDVINITNQMREDVIDEEREEFHWTKNVTTSEIEMGMSIIKIDEGLLPEWESVFGKEEDAKDPVVKIKNGMEHYPTRRKFKERDASASAA